MLESKIPIEGVEYQIHLASGEEIIIPKTHLENLKEPGISSITTQPQYYQQQTNNLSMENTAIVYTPKTLHPSNINLLANKSLNQLTFT